MSVIPSRPSFPRFIVDVFLTYVGALWLGMALQWSPWRSIALGFAINLFRLAFTK